MAEPAELLVGNGRVITHDAAQPFLENGCVAIADGLITAIGPTAELVPAHPAARFLDAQGRVIMPGLINTHTHFYAAFARGLAPKDPAPANLTQILERLWWRLDKALTLDDVYWSAMAGLVDCIRNGVTTVFDHHASPSAPRVSLFRIAEAARQLGLRACLAYEVSDRDGPEIARQGIEENRAFLETCLRKPEPLIRGLFGLHASFTLSDQTLDQCRAVAADLGAGFHVHTAESLADLDHCMSEYQMRVVERWHLRGILGARTIAAHCVHISEREIDLLRDSNTSVVHNPQSNMANAVGCAPVPEMMLRQVRVGLGTDGYTTDMFESMRAGGLIQKHQAGDPRAASGEPPLMLFRENAAIASDCFGLTLGTLTPGAAADIILVDYDPPTPLDSSTVDGHIAFGLSGRAVSTTIVAGRILMNSRKFLHLDEAEVMAHARAAASEVWKRF